MASAFLDDPRMMALSMELPGLSGRTSWAYLLEDDAGSMHLLDCGADSDANHQALAEGLSRRGKSIADLASVTATHAHYDHVGMAARLRRESGASIGLHDADADAMSTGRTYGGPCFPARLRRWEVPESAVSDLVEAAGRKVARGEPARIDRLLVDGDRLDIPGWELHVLATPGHTQGHICLVDGATRAAFVGDHVLPDSNPAAGLGGPTVGNPIDEYASSLAYLASAEPSLLLPGHGSPIVAVQERIAAVRANQRRRRDDIQSAVATAGSRPTVWGIASSLHWSGGWGSLNGIRRFSALNQVDHHLESIGRQ